MHSCAIEYMRGTIAVTVCGLSPIMSVLITVRSVLTEQPCYSER